MRTVLTMMLLLSLPGLCPAQQAPQVGSRDSDTAETQAQAPKKEAAKPAQPPKNDAAKPAKPADKPEKAAPAAEKGDDEPATPTPPKSKLPPPSTLFAEIGYGDWGLSGSENTFRKYATPAHSLFLRDLRYAPMLKSPSENAFFDVKGLGQDDYRAEARLNWSYGATQASGFLSRFRFLDPVSVQADTSSRHVEGFSAKQSITRDFAVDFLFRNDGQKNNYDIPFFNLDQNTQFWDAAATGKLGPEFVSLTYSNLQYSDHTGTLLGHTTQTTGLSYLWNATRTIDVEAAYAHVAISEPSIHQSHLDILSVTGDVALNSTTDVNLRYQQRNVGMPGVQNAYVRAQGLGTAGLFHRWKSWRAQLGFRLQEDERVNGDQTFVDVPKWSTVEGRLSGKVLPDWRLTVRGYTQTLFDPPSAITMDTNPLYWNGRNYVQAKLEGGPSEITYYLVYTYQANRNSARSSEVQTTQYTLGSVWQIAPTVSLFGEYHHESWSGHTDFDAFPALGNFLPNGATSIVELTWNLPRLFMSASFTNFSERNDNPLLLQDGNASGSFLTLSGRYRFPRGYELGLTFAPWYYRDKVASALDYTASVVMLTGSARF